MVASAGSMIGFVFYIGRFGLRVNIFFGILEGRVYEPKTRATKLMLERYLMAEPESYALIALGLSTGARADSATGHIIKMKNTLKTIIELLPSTPQKFV